MLEIPIDLEDIDPHKEAGDDASGPAPGEECVVIVKQGIIQKSNEAMVRLSGYRHEEVIDTIFASFFHLDDIALVESICEPPMPTRSEPPPSVVRLIGKNGKPIPVQISAGSPNEDEAPFRLIRIRNL